MAITHIQVETTLSDGTNQLKGYKRTDDGTFYHENTPDQVIKLLQAARTGLIHPKLRLFLGDQETGWDWMEEHDVYGYIGRSNGRIKVPLIVGRFEPYGSNGGPAILTDCIIRIIMPDKGGPRCVYSHPNYQVPFLRIIDSPATPEMVEKRPHIQGYPWAVMRTVCRQVADGYEEEIARFYSWRKARHWCAFMQGRRFCK